ncbi:MAG TPA: ABC transporter ATP-binding protein [Actinomycetota bacterium]|jgi:branched-chain amino acid transport system ATP-binding protein|nr:ABC transporter ATP-binding protein [Actinomycetota bacterium]
MGPEPPPPVLGLRGVRAGYSRIEVLHGVDLVVPAGTIVGLLGPNGAGKSTTLGVVSGQIRPTAGSVTMAGHDVTGAAADQLARLGVCTIPEGRGVFPNLTVAENVLMFTHRGVSERDAEEIAYGHFPVLAERRRLAAGRLSAGEQQMLALARALATRPALLLLDELSMGLAPLVVERLYEQVASITETGVAILLVEQFAGHLLGVADQVAMMVHGRIRAAGRPQEMAGQLSGAYLGGERPKEDQ